MPDYLKDKSYNFALRIIKLSKYLQETKKEFILSKQVIRSGTAIGALVRESKNAESTKDFIHKLAIAQKETDETIYWLELMVDSEIIETGKIVGLKEEAVELLKMLKSSIVTLKKKL